MTTALIALETSPISRLCRVSSRNQVNNEDGAPSDPLIRVVTITGSPRAAQTAQYLITQKLQLANAGSDGSGAKHRR